jgi:hypothetical protein
MVLSAFSTSVLGKKNDWLHGWIINHVMKHFSTRMLLYKVLGCPICWLVDKLEALRANTYIYLSPADASPCTGGFILEQSTLT